MNSINYQNNPREIDEFAISMMNEYEKIKIYHDYEGLSNLAKKNLEADRDKLAAKLREIRSHDLKVLMPDINKSTNRFVIDGNNIIFPFSTIKGVGTSVSSLVLRSRDKEFTDIYDAFSKLVRAGVTKKQLESLINADAFRSLGYNKKTLITNLDSLVNYGTLTIDLDESLVLKPEIIITNEFPNSVLLEQEEDCFGFYISNHPVTTHRSKYQNIVSINCIGNYFNRIVNVMVMVEKVKAIKTKKNEDMAFVTASDETGQVDFIFFPRVYKNNMDIKKGDICIFTGTVEKRYDELQLVVSKINYIRRENEEEE